MIGMELLRPFAAALCLASAGCARTEPAPAEAEDIETAVHRADEGATKVKTKGGEPWRQP